MSTNATRHFQFSLSELISIVAMTFLGMMVLEVLLVPAPPIFAAITAILSTAIGAFAIVRCVKIGPLRSMCLLIGVPLSWVVAYLLIRLSQQPEILLIIGGFFLPALIGGFIGWLRCCGKEFSDRADTKFVINHVVWSCLVCYTIEFAAFIIVPSMLRSRFPESGHPAAAAMCKAFAEAEEIYHRTDYNGDGVLEYCTKMTGATSLATNNGVEIALIDRAFAAAEGPHGTPKAGYLFRILTAQRLPVVRSYIDKEGRMTLGYALIAYPASYDSTGRDTFMISSAGTIYQADLGPNTTQIVGAMTEFDPLFPTWTPTE